MTKRPARRRDPSQLPKLILAIPVLVSLVSCSVSTTGWTKAGVTPAQQRTDSYECERDAGGATPYFPRQSIFNRCMEAKGYIR